MGDVIEASFITSLDIPADRVLRNAQEAKLGTAVVIGQDADGGLYFSSSAADCGTVLWLIEMAKKQLLELGDDR